MSAQKWILLPLTAFERIEAALEFYARGGSPTDLGIKAEQALAICAERRRLSAHEKPKPKPCDLAHGE